MVITDIFLAKLTADSAISIDELHIQLDRHAPAPWIGVCPRGEPVAIFAIDFRQSPAAVCARLGIEYCHAGFWDISAELYRQDHAMRFESESFKWVKLFMKAWAVQESERNSHALVP